MISREKVAKHFNLLEFMEGTRVKINLKNLIFHPPIFVPKRHKYSVNEFTYPTGFSANASEWR